MAWAGRRRGRAGRRGWAGRGGVGCARAGARVGAALPGHTAQHTYLPKTTEAPNAGRALRARPAHSAGCTSGPHTPSAMSRAALSGRSTTPAALMRHNRRREGSSEATQPASRSRGAARPGPHRPGPTQQASPTEPAPPPSRPAQPHPRVSRPHLAPPYPHPRASRTPHPAPRTPHPAPRTPHPAPRTPHPAPRTDQGAAASRSSTVPDMIVRTWRVMWSRGQSHQAMRVRRAMSSCG
jgi:hypothetical protein